MEPVAKYINVSFKVRVDPLVLAKDVKKKYKEGIEVNFSHTSQIKITDGELIKGR